MTNKITDKNTLKSWFQRGLKPLASQFAAWMDSYWHKDEKIPTASVEGLEEVLNHKAEAGALDQIRQEVQLHLDDDSRHKTEAEQSKLDHLADDPDATYARREELLELEDNPDVIIIPVDFTTTTYPEDVKAFADPLFEDGRIFEKPVFLKYIWKEDYVTEGAAEYTCLVAGETNPNNAEQFIFNSPVPVVEADYPDEPYAYRILLGKGRIRFTEYKDEKMVLINIPSIPNGAVEGVPVFFGSVFWTDFGKAVEAYFKNRDLMVCVRSTEGSGVAKLSISRGVEDSRNSIVELSGTIPLYSQNKFKNYFFRVVSDEFLYVNADSIKNVNGTCYGYTVGLEEKEYNTLYVDLALIPEGGTIQDKAVSDSIREQCLKFKNLNNLFLLCFITSSQKKYVVSEVSSSTSVNEQFAGLEVTAVLPEEVADQIGGDKLVIIFFRDQSGKENHMVIINLNTAQRSDIVYLTDDNDGFLSVTDRNWTILDQLLDKGKQPIVYLLSKYSEGYCPARYEFKRDEETNKLSGFVEISYLKTVEGKKELWIERRKFVNGCGSGAMYETDVNTNELLITKIPLEDSVRVSRIQLVEDYPADLSAFKDGDIIIKQNAAV